jgi:hypothetical protein
VIISEREINRGPETEGRDRRPKLEEEIQRGRGEQREGRNRGGYT